MFASVRTKQLWRATWETDNASGLRGKVMGVGVGHRR